nr:hypothetical protein [Tanacetum cinerariifolium]
MQDDERKITWIKWSKVLASKKYGGLGTRTMFWRDTWFGDVPFCSLFPRLYALENEKDSTVAVKMQDSIALSFWRSVRGGAETQQLESLQDLIGSKVLSNVQDRWV